MRPPKPNQGRECWVSRDPSRISGRNVSHNERAGVLLIVTQRGPFRSGGLHLVGQPKKYLGNDCATTQAATNSVSQPLIGHDLALRKC